MICKNSLNIVILVVIVIDTILLIVLQGPWTNIRKPLIQQETSQINNSNSKPSFVRDISNAKNTDKKDIVINTPKKNWFIGQKEVTKSADSKSSTLPNQGDIFNYDTSYNQVCKAGTYNLIRPFIEEQWFLAKKDLNLPRKPDSYSEERLFVKDHKYYIDKMYRFNTGLVLFQIKDTLIGYLRLYKCVNEGIHYNLKQYMINEGYTFHNSSIVVNQRKDFIDFKNNLHFETVDTFSGFLKPINLATPELQTKHHQFKTFTVIRDPIQRLQSSFTEAILRNDKLTEETTTSTIRKWYIDILNYKNIHYLKPIRSLDLTYPMSGAFFEFDVDIILAEERFEENWEKVIVPTYNLPPNSYNNLLGRHPSSLRFPSQNQNSKNIQTIKSFRRVFGSIKKEDPKLWQAMCRLILIDYVCFPQYELPKSCQHLQKDVERGRAMLLKKEDI